MNCFHDFKTLYENVTTVQDSSKAPTKPERKFPSSGKLETKKVRQLLTRFDMFMYLGSYFAELVSLSLSNFKYLTILILSNSLSFYPSSSGLISNYWHHVYLDKIYLL